MARQYAFDELAIAGVIQITPFFSSDERGSSSKDYSREVFRDHGIRFDPVEILTIVSKKNVLRGLHFQKARGQGKLIRCISGNVWAVVADVRKDSKTCGKWVSAEISDGKELIIPKDCAFGTYALEDSQMMCMCDDVFVAEYAAGIRWDDPTLKIEWPFMGQEMPTISEKDAGLPLFEDYLKES